MAQSFASQAHLRRFYCAADFGPDWRAKDLLPHSRTLAAAATAAGFTPVTKRVKYIRRDEGHVSKCDLDIDIATDLFSLRDSYDRVVLFSGDGDFVPALTHLSRNHGKEIVVIGAAGTVGREIFDAHGAGVISTIIYADDLKYQLDGWWV